MSKRLIDNKTEYTFLDFLCDKFNKVLLFVAHACLSKRRKNELHRIIDEVEENRDNIDQANHIVKGKEELEAAIDNTMKGIQKLKTINTYYKEVLEDITIAYSEENISEIGRILNESNFIKSLNY